MQNKQTLFTVIRETIKKLTSVTLRYSSSFFRWLVISSHVIFASFADELLSHVPCKHIKTKIWRHAFRKLLVQNHRYVLTALSAMTATLSGIFFLSGLTYEAILFSPLIFFTHALMTQVLLWRKNNWIIWFLGEPG